MNRHVLAILIVMLAASCATKDKPEKRRSYFGDALHDESKTVVAEEPVEEINENEIDTGFGIAVTPPEGWMASEPEDGAIVIAAPGGSVVRIEAFKADDTFMDRIKAWHDDFTQLSSVKEPLNEATLAGQKAWKGTYQFVFLENVVSQTIWELPHGEHFYSLHVGVSSVSEKSATRTLLDSIRFVEAPRSGELHGDLLGASVDSTALSDKKGSAKLSPRGWKKQKGCGLPGCAAGWTKKDGALRLFRRQYASPASAKNDTKAWVSRFERMGDTVRATKHGKNSGHLVFQESGRIWFAAIGSSIWMLRLDVADPAELATAQGMLEKTIAAAKFK